MGKLDVTPETSHQEKDLRWELLRNRKYLVLMAAQAISNLGDWLYILALFVMVGFRWHGSPMTISLMMLCLTGPMVLLGPFTGLLADKWNRTTLMMVSNLVMAVLVGLIPWLPTRGLVFVVLAVVGVFQSIFNPAESGKLKEIVSDEHMQQAASINSSIVQLTKIIGPGISGFLVGMFGSLSAFWLDALSFVLSTILLVFTGFKATFRDEASPSPALVESEQVDSTEKTTAKQRFLEGIHHIRKTRSLWVGTAILTIALLIIQMTDAQLVTLIRLMPGASGRLVGLIMALSGAGGLVAALLIASMKWKSANRVMALGCLAMGVAIALVAISVQYAVLHLQHLNAAWIGLICLLSIAIGGAAGFVFIPFQSMAQKCTPSHLTGRVFGAIGSLTTAAALLGPVLGGVIVVLIGVIQAYATTAVLLLLMGALAFVFSNWLDQGTASGESESSVSV